MSDDEKPRAVLVPGPTPNSVCMTADLFSGSLDVLAYSEQTQFRNGTCLVIDVDGTESRYALGLCASHHVHLHLGLSTQVGQCSVIAVAAYALALSYDREAWSAGYIPSTENVKQALRDCLAVLKEHATDRYVEWLTQRCARELAGWTKSIRASGGALTPHSDHVVAEA